MINILKDGYKKTFYHKCLNCATDFSYTVEDVRNLEENPYWQKTKVVDCPRCGDKQFVMLNENQKNAFCENPIAYGLRNCCCCDTNEEGFIDG